MSATIAFVALFVLFAGAPMFTSDAFWQVATGDYLRAVSGFPARDPFSFTANDQPWVLHEWLTQVVFSLVHGLAGWWGLRVLTAAFALLALVQVARLYRRHLGGGAAAALLGMALFAALGSERIQARPTLVTIAVLLAFVGLWTRPGPWRRRDAALVVGLELLWVNAHSVALLGPVLYGVFLVGRAVDAFVARRGGLQEHAPRPGDLSRHAATWAMTVLVTLATPAGVHLWTFAWQDKSDVMQYVDDEWAPFHLAYADNPVMPRVVWVLVLATIATVLAAALLAAVALEREQDRLRSARLPVPSRVLLGLAFLFGGLMARRFVWFHALTLLFALEVVRRLARGGAFAALSRRCASPEVRRVAAAGVAVVALGWAGLGLAVEGRPVALATVGAPYWTEPLARGFLLPGVEFLADCGIEGNVVCHYNSGGILSQRLFPRVRVFIDSRIDLYRRAVFLDYQAVLLGHREQQQVLDRHGADVYYQHWQLPPPVDGRAWLPVYRGPDGQVLLRKGAQHTAENLERARTWHERRGSTLPAEAPYVRPADGARPRDPARPPTPR